MIYLTIKGDINLRNGITMNEYYMQHIYMLQASKKSNYSIVALSTYCNLQYVEYIVKIPFYKISCKNICTYNYNYKDECMTKIFTTKN